MARWWQGEINMDLLWRRIIFLSKRIVVLHPKDPFVGIPPMLYAVYLRVYFLALRSGSCSRVGFPSFAVLPGSFAILPFDCELRSFLDDSSSWFLLVDLRTLKLSASSLCLRFPSYWVVIVDTGLWLHPSCIGSSFMLLVICRLDVVGMLCFLSPLSSVLGMDVGTSANLLF